MNFWNIAIYYSKGILLVSFHIFNIFGLLGFDLFTFVCTFLFLFSSSLLLLNKVRYCSTCFFYHFHLDFHVWNFVRAHSGAFKMTALQNLVHLDFQSKSKNIPSGQWAYTFANHFYFYKVFNLTHSYNVTMSYNLILRMSGSFTLYIILYQSVIIYSIIIWNIQKAPNFPCFFKYL